MGTYSKAYINNNDFVAVKAYIGKYYNVVSEEYDTIEQDWRFWKNKNDTIILSQEFNANWIEIQLNKRYSLYFHDELLRRISLDLHTTILYGYYQSTDGIGRLSKFQNGKLNLSIVQREVGYKEDTMMRLIDNWGLSKKIKEEFSIPEINEKYFDIDWDLIYRFYKINGLEWDKIKRDDAKYLHLEINY